jgi:hypothetical protein
VVFLSVRPLRKPRLSEDKGLFSCPADGPPNGDWLDWWWFGDSEVDMAARSYGDKMNGLVCRGENEFGGEG